MAKLYIRMLPSREAETIHILNQKWNAEWKFCKASLCLFHMTIQTSIYMYIHIYLPFSSSPISLPIYLSLSPSSSSPYLSNLSSSYDELLSRFFGSYFQLWNLTAIAVKFHAVTGYSCAIVASATRVSKICAPTPNSFIYHILTLFWDSNKILTLFWIW